jgi:mRNA-degrading endonuclease toxin of MazEF toxin-antitoxin module
MPKKRRPALLLKGRQWQRRLCVHVCVHVCACVCVCVRARLPVYVSMRAYV